MSFSGKKFRRIGCTNIDHLMKSSKYLAAMLRCNAPIFSYHRIDAETFVSEIVMNDRVARYTFKLNQEFEMERLDGVKIKFTYRMDNDDVLHKTMTLPNGKSFHFRKELSSPTPRSVIKSSGCDAEAIVYYEVVN